MEEDQQKGKVCINVQLFVAAELLQLMTQVYLSRYVLLLPCNIWKNITVQCELVLEYSWDQGGHFYTALWKDKEIQQDGYGGVNKHILL